MLAQPMGKSKISLWYQRGSCWFQYIPYILNGYSGSFSADETECHRGFRLVEVIDE